VILQLESLIYLFGLSPHHEALMKKM